LDMLSRPAGERRELGQEARARIEANFALDQVVAQYAALYESLASRTLYRK
jgi:glycosyltransferase involved in cell wall biosynthesis